MSIRTEREKAKLREINPNVQLESLRPDCFSDMFFHDIGAESVESLDFSDFEGSEHNFNLNRSFEQDSETDHLKESYDIVLDYGTSEHVFQPAQSIVNSLYMLKTGGYLNLVLPVSGWLEHGFYQFSPNIFRAMNSPYLELKELYIFNPYKVPLRFWNGLKVINNPNYEKLNGRYSAFAVYRKIGAIKEDAFLQSVQQGVYVSVWDEDRKQKIAGQHSNSQRSLFLRVKRGVIRYLVRFRWFQAYSMRKQKER